MAALSDTGFARTYEVRTYGCQMNVHDSERLSGLLEDSGLVPVSDGQTADVIVFNTCAVRENAVTAGKRRRRRPAAIAA